MTASICRKCTGRPTARKYGWYTDSDGDERVCES